MKKEKKTVGHQKSAVKTSLFVAEERECKLDRLGDILKIMNQNVDFVALEN